MNEKSQYGLGVMLQWLGGNQETVESIRQCLEQKIAKIQCDDSTLLLEFDNGKKLTVWDNGQSCCERRYMSCDDELDYFIGSKLVNMEVVDGGRGGTKYDVHDIQFLNVTTDKGVFQIANHNEHNGYYGGFSIAARLS